jgi:HEAT repeat protein
MPMKKRLNQFTLAGLLVTATVLAQTPYDEGQRALREQRWTDAAEQFEQAVKDDSGQADAAMYWTAFAYYKAGRGHEAERELRRLERKYPQSPWIKEARSLQIEHQKSMESIEKVVSGDTVMDDELRLFALSRLMERDPDQALPLLMDLMRNSESEKVRNDALFVLAVSEQPPAQQALFDFARDSSDPELQRIAIHMLGTMDANAELQSLYPTLQSTESKVAVIQALSIAGDSSMLKQVLSTETDPELRRAAIQGIAMEDNAGAAELLASIYESATSRDEKLMVLQALTIMDDAEDLALKILRTEKDPELQRQAIHALGIMDATEELGGLYTELDGHESRIAVIQALSIADDTDALFHILQTESDQELRSAAIHGLAINGGKRAGDYLAELYPNAKREEKSTVIQSMMIMDDSEGLLQLLKQENDPELKREMLQMLTTMDSEVSDEYLFELLEKNG